MLQKWLILRNKLSFMTSEKERSLKDNIRYFFIGNAEKDIDFYKFLKNPWHIFVLSAFVFSYVLDYYYLVGFNLMFIGLLVGGYEIYFLFLVLRYHHGDKFEQPVVWLSVSFFFFMYLLLFVNYFFKLGLDWKDYLTTPSTTVFTFALVYFTYQQFSLDKEKNEREEKQKKDILSAELGALRVAALSTFQEINNARVCNYYFQISGDSRSGSDWLQVYSGNKTKLIEYEYLIVKKLIQAERCFPDLTDKIEAYKKSVDGARLLDVNLQDIERMRNLKFEDLEAWKNSEILRLNNAISEVFEKPINAILLHIGGVLKQSDEKSSRNKN